MLGWTDLIIFQKRLNFTLGKKHDLLVANFSTTGLIEKAASEVVLMDSMKQYFEYKCTTRCGIPEINLLGTTEDWISIQNRVQAFAEFEGLADWAKLLDPLLGQFVNASKGQVDKDFWNNMYKNQNFGSGGPHVSGWANAFFLYLQTSKGYQLNPIALDLTKTIYPSSIDYPSGISKVPFIWDYHGKEYEYEFLGGFLGTSQAEDLSIRPAIGWAVRPK